MRIFCIHKSKSKKQVSEKSPKLAAQKFLEKRKVGTVIYLHEHPSGKIHGPYRKEYDKKIMKGGTNDLRLNDFKISVNPPQFLEGTNQLIIKEERKTFFKRFIFREPYIFFGDNTLQIEGIPVYTHVINNFQYIPKKNNNKNSFVQEFIVCRKLETVNGKYMLTLVKISEINSKILLGLYYQYIELCKQDYPSLKDIENYYGLHMKRLFLYLLLYVLPILIRYISEIVDNYDDESIKEKEYFTNIVNYFENIDFEKFIDMFARVYNMPQNFKEEFKQQFTKHKMKENKNNTKTFEEISDVIIRSSVSLEKKLEPPQSSISGAVSINTPHPLAIIAAIPFILTVGAIAGLLCGSFFLSKKLIEKIKIKKTKNRNGNGNGNEN